MNVDGIHAENTIAISLDQGLKSLTDSAAIILNDVRGLSPSHNKLI